MRAFRFIHTADLHLDTPFQGTSFIKKEVEEKESEQVKMSELLNTYFKQVKRIGTLMVMII